MSFSSFDPSYERWTLAFGRFISFESTEVIFWADGVIQAMGEFQENLHLKRSDAYCLVSLLMLFQCEESIAKSRFAVVGGMRGVLPDPLVRFFFVGSDGRYRLSTDGLATLSEFTTVLRRVLCDRDEFYRLKFGRFTPEERAKRWARKRFNTELTESERIAVLREYWAMPLNTEEDKKARKVKRLEIFARWDLRNWDLINAVKKYGDLVRSIRRRPDIAHLFPRENKKA